MTEKFDIEEHEKSLIEGLKDPAQVAKWKADAAAFDAAPQAFWDLLKEAVDRTMEKAERDGIVTKRFPPMDS